MTKRSNPKTDETTIPICGRPHDWTAIDRCIADEGVVVLQEFLNPVDLKSLNEQIDHYLDRDREAGAPQSGSSAYDFFLGDKTLRLQGLINKVPGAAALIGDEALVSWAERTMKQRASSVLLSAGEMIQIQPGEPAQLLHRDSDSWPGLPRNEYPVVVNAIIALDDFTPANGATHVAPGSWDWNEDRTAAPHETMQAEMRTGDAVLFRGDLIHGGGANKTDARRRAISVSYCAGWLRPVENSFLNLPISTVRTLPPRLQAVLGYGVHDGTDFGAGLVGLYEGGDPSRALN